MTTDDPQAKEAVRQIAWQVCTYYDALRSKSLPVELVHSLVVDYHRALIAPRDNGYTLHFRDYGEYLDAWERQTVGHSLAREG